MELRQYLRIAKKWWWLIIVSILVAAVTSFGVSNSMLPPVYRASTKLLVKDGNNNDIYLASEYMTATYKELLSRPSIIKMAAQNLDLPPGQITTEQVQIRLIPKTPLIELTVEHNDPRVAMGIANEIVRAFREMARKSKWVPGSQLLVVEGATQPREPIAPRKLLNTLLAAIVGGALAAGAVFFIEYLDDLLKTEEDIHHSLSLPTLAVIPYSKGHHKQSEIPVVLDDSSSPITEAYHILRAKLQFSYSDGSLRTLLVTSPSDQEEQAYLVANLGIVLAQAGFKVLLVDTDLRQPQLHRLFGLAAEPGLSTVLSRARDCQECIVKTHIPNLRLLSGGSGHTNSLELLSSPQMGSLIEELKAQNDFVLFKASAMLTTAEAVMLASQMDGTILVLDSRSAQREAVIRVLDRLRDVEAKVLGVVLLNRVRARSLKCYSEASKLEKQSLSWWHNRNGHMRRTEGAEHIARKNRFSLVDRIKIAAFTDLDKRQDGHR